MGRGLSGLQRWLLDQRPHQAPADLAHQYYGEVSAAGRVAVCRALARLQERGLLPLTKNSPKWPLSVNERAQIVQADCLAFFSQLPAGSVDLVFGSPPYVDARQYRDDGKPIRLFRHSEEWAAWMVEVYRAALARCRGLVAFVVEGRTKKYRYDAAPHLLAANLHRAGIHLRKDPIFHRVGIPRSGGPDWLRNDYEPIICATNGGRLPWSDNTAMGKAPKWNPGGRPAHRQQNGQRVNAVRHRTGPDEGERQTYHPPAIANPGNVITCKVGGGNMGDPLCHDNEAPFPESLAEFFVLSFCPPAGWVCDPFCGSGTTGEVALRWGRRFVGCDLRQSQVDLTRRRLAAACMLAQEAEGV